METRDFLFELGTEELPPKALKKLSESLLSSFEKGLTELFSDHKELLADTQFRAFASPRRLAIFAEKLPTHTPSKTTEVTGPPAKISIDANGNPTKALEGFAKKCGVTVPELSQSNGKFCFVRQEPEQPIEAHLAALVQKALDQLPIPKRMRWGANKFEFVRPAKWVVMLLGDKVVDANILGHQAGRVTYGHRFHYSQAIELNAPAEYQSQLGEKGYVVADFAERRSMIIKQVNQAASEKNGTAVIDENLLDEVTALVEWPVALAGRFEDRFLEVPSEALVSSMKEHQKYFHIVDDSGVIMPFFITVSNIESQDPQQVISGNERVIRPRLADAAFFYETDKKTTLESRIDRLKPIVFQAKLGSVYDKSVRVSKLAGEIASRIGADRALAERAGMLSKTDLVTEMVLEFDDLQGLMGHYYALHDGENPELAKALEEQYHPRFAGDTLPTTATGSALAMADRLDTLVGLFGINQPPSGSKDPFALRRATLGVLRTMVESELDLDLAEILPIAAEAHNNLSHTDDLANKVIDFMLERFRAWYDDSGIPVEVFLAVSATRPTRPLDFAKRINAVNDFRQLPEAESLAAANKRVSNIISKAELATFPAVNSALFTEAAETALYELLEQAKATATPLFEASNYGDAYANLAALKKPVDAFFDSVMVMADDEATRLNRLALLNELRALFLKGADISLL